MIRKKRWRYYCEFCKKSGGSAHHMRYHEAHCTMNPKRECGVCQYTENDGAQPEIKDLLACLPPAEMFEAACMDEDIAKELFPDFSQHRITQGMHNLRKAAGNCPACILAALRQHGVISDLVGFDFKKEMDAVWEDVNAAEREACQHG